MADPLDNTAGTPDVGVTLGGRYRVVRQIGEGGMGVVVEAENTVTGKRVAIKWMHPQVAARPEAAERFLREARASARVRHPNVVDVYDAVHEGSTCFLVMELLEGEPLTYLLARGGMPAHELIALLLDSMRGVAAAHRQGVIHRDIKPDNIFLASEPDRATKTPKVLDFGISKVIGSDALSLTRTGATMGTPLYMSYEQLCGVKDIDARTDVYAFGVVLYEALTGQPPYQAESFPELIVKITNTQPAPPKQLRPDIPTALDRLVQRAMSKERETRIASLEQLIRELEPFATAHSFRAQLTERSLVVEGRDSSPIATPMEASVSIPPAPRRRDALPWLVVAGAVTTLLGALTFFSASPQPEAAQLPAPSPPAAPSGQPVGPAAAAAPAPITEPQAIDPAADKRARGAQNADPAEAKANAKLQAAKALEAQRKAAETRAVAAPAPAPNPARPAARVNTPARAPLPPSAADTHMQAETPPRPAPAPATADPNRFRAGRPRSQDF